MTWGTQVLLERLRTAGAAGGARRDRVAAYAGLVLAHMGEERQVVDSPAAYSQPPSTALTRIVSSTSSQQPGQAGQLKPDVTGARCPPGGREHLVGLDRSPVVQHQRDRAALTRTAVSARGCLRVASRRPTPTRTSTPASRSPAATRSPAKSGSRSSSRPVETSVTSEQRADQAVAISQPTTPPPTITRRPGTACALVASRLVHGLTPASTAGTAAVVPVAITTACRARSTVLPTWTRRSRRRSCRGRGRDRSWRYPATRPVRRPSSCGRRSPAAPAPRAG